MAWRAIVINRQSITNHTGSALRLVVGYYDDADPANTPTPNIWLARKEFVFDGEDLTATTIRNTIIEQGQLERAAANRVDAALASPQLEPGQSIAIP